MGICTSAVDKGKTALKELVSDDKKYNEMVDQAWSKFDQNGDGNLEGKELQGMINELIKKIKKDSEGVDEEKINSALSSLDENKDGKLSKEEFKKASKAKILMLCS